jgi:hypothetical protein
MTGEYGQLYAAQFSPDGSLIAAGGAGTKDARIFDVKANYAVRRSVCPIFMRGSILSHHCARRRYFTQLPRAAHCRLVLLCSCWVGCVSMAKAFTRSTLHPLVGAWRWVAGTMSLRCVIFKMWVPPPGRRSERHGPESGTDLSAATGSMRPATPCSSHSVHCAWPSCAQTRTSLSIGAFQACRSIKLFSFSFAHRVAKRTSRTPTGPGAMHASTRMH